MKIDKWPEEIEVDGWVFERYSVPMRGHITKGSIASYYAKEKIHVPPTVQECFQHLIDGGWVKAEYGNAVAYWRLDKYGSKDLQVAFFERGTLLRFRKSCDFTFTYEDMKVTLCKSGVVDVYEGNVYVGSR